MKNDLFEDMKDVQEIKRQKEKQKKSNEQMSTWKFGKGLKNNKEGDKNGVRSKI